MNPCILRFHAPQLYLRVNYPLRFFVCYVHVVTQQSKSTSIIKVATIKNTDGAMHYHLKLKNPLPYTVSYVQLITQQYESRTI